MATDQGDGTVAIVDLHTLRLTRTLPARGGAIANALSFMPGGRTLVTGGVNGRVTFWNVGTGSVTRTLRFSDPVYLSAISPDGSVLAVQTQADKSPDTHVEMRSVATGKVLLNRVVPHGYAGLEFTRDGRELVALGCCASGSTLVAWDAHTGAELWRRSAGANATSFDVTPDSRLIGIGTADGKVLLLDSRTGDRTARRSAFRRATSPVSRSPPTAGTFAASSNDGTASLWDLRSRKRLGNPFPPYPGAVPAIRVRAQRPAADDPALKRVRVADRREIVGALCLPRRGPRPDAGGMARSPPRSCLSARMPGLVRRVARPASGRSHRLRTLGGDVGPRRGVVVAALDHQPLRLVAAARPLQSKAARGASRREARTPHGRARAPPATGRDRPARTRRGPR